MNKSLVLSVILLCGFMPIRADVPQKTTIAANPAEVQPKITIADPGARMRKYETLIRNHTLHITWTHSAWFDAHPLQCRIVIRKNCGMCPAYFISHLIPVTADSFDWTIGKQCDGQYIDQGSYRLLLVTPENNGVAEGPLITFTNDEAKIYFLQPPLGDTLIMGSKISISWGFSNYFYVMNKMKCVLFCGDTRISEEIPVLDGKFEWTVGSKVEVRKPAFIVGRPYRLSIQCIAGDSIQNPTITLAPMPLIPATLK